MIRSKFLPVLILLVLANTFSYAQNTFSFQDYHFDRFSVSPAYAGFTGPIEGDVSYSKEWVGFPGSPQDISLNLDASLLKNMGVGIALGNEKTGIFQSTSFAPAYAYRLNISKNNLIALGLQAKIYMQNINTSGAQMAISDPVVSMNQNVSAITVAPGFGMVYGYKTFETGLYIANFVMNNVKLNDNINYNLVRQIQWHASCSMGLHSGITFEPAVFIVNQANKSLLYTISGFLDFMNAIWIGMSFHDGSNLGFMLGASPYENLVVQYSYEYSNSPVFQYSSGSNKISIAFVIKNKKTDEQEKNK